MRSQEATLPDIFLSYTRDDQTVARRFADALEAEHLSVWWDATLRSGEAYDEVTETALREAKAVIVLWSKKSVVSRWVRAEATLAHRNKTLMPAMIEPCERPIMFELTQTADLCGWCGDRSDAAWRRFLADVKRFVEKDSARSECASTSTATENASERTPSGKIIAEPPANSICVLPFVNMSGDPEQEFFADGLTEDIITELSRFRHLFIISRNSAFQYKGKTVAARQVAQEFNVRYVVEGSVRKSGNRVRVSAQLVDGLAGRHIWAERYDRQLEDIFQLQDEVTSAIVGMLPGRVEAAAGERMGRKPTENMNAYECVLAGKLLHHRATRDDNVKALELLDRAIVLDPSYAHAHAWKACTLGQAWINGYSENPDATLKDITGELGTALQLDGNDSDVHRILAAVHLTRKQHDKALFHQRRALELNPNDDLVVVQQGEILTWLGQPEEGIQWIEKAMRLNPCHPERFWNHLGRAYFVARRYSDAISTYGHIAAPNALQHSCLAACYAELGNDSESRRHVAEVLAREPGFSVNAFLRTLHYKRPEDIEHHREALLKAGLPA